MFDPFATIKSIAAKMQHAKQKRDFMEWFASLSDADQESALEMARQAAARNRAEMEELKADKDARKMLKDWANTASSSELEIGIALARRIKSFRNNPQEQQSFEQAMDLVKPTGKAIFALTEADLTAWPEPERAIIRDQAAKFRAEMDKLK
jgi:hypothetical protein